MKIALTGGIACGKSTFAKFLEELGIRVLDADDVVHELEAPGGRAVPLLVKRFGPEVLDAQGGIDRRKLAEMVFTDSGASSARADLEAILFPLVRERMQAFVSSAADESACKYRIASIPLLFESHFDSDYDIIICIASPMEVQVDRMMCTRGYSRAQAEARLSAQMPVAEKADRAHFTVINDKTPQHLRTEALRLLSWLEERTKDEH